MKKIVTIIIFLCLVSIYADAENIETSKYEELSDRIQDFWGDISRISRPGNNTDKNFLSRIAKRYENRDTYYFKYNNEKIRLADFLFNYKSSVLEDDYIQHEFKLNEITADSRGKELYMIKGKLSRKYLFAKDDFVIVPIDVKMLVFYNSDNSPKSRVKVMEIIMEKAITKVYPKTYYDYTLIVKPSQTHISHEGGTITIDITSYRSQMKEYPGLKKEEIGNTETVVASVEADNVKIRKFDNKYHISINPNYSQKIQNFNLTISQYGGKTESINITQDYNENSIKKAFQFKRSYYDRLWDISLHYSPKYNIGVSAMYTPEESRFSFGGIIASNFDSFRGIDWGTDVSVSILSTGSAESSVGSIWPTSDIVNGYKITQETLNPEENNYSSIFDPYNEAKHYKSRTLIMANIGFHITNWWNISLGIGPIIYRDLYFMETTYDVIRTSYNPMQEGLPAINDVYTYRKHSGTQNYYFKNPTKWDLGIRPAVNFTIPLGEDIYMPIGCGYIIPTFGKLKDCNSFDFNIGISFNY